MLRTRSTPLATLLAGVAALVLVSCHGTVASDASKPVRPAPSAAASSPDIRTCAGAEAILGHMAAETARWSPNRHPFDKDVERRIALRAGQLAQQSAQARTAKVKLSVHDTATAFTTVAHAMTSRSRVAVAQSIQTLRIRYGQLKLLCAWDR
jgi:hypothetical protein